MECCSLPYNEAKHLQESLVVLVEVNRNHLKINRCDTLKLQQNIEQGITVFTTRHTHHDLIAIFNHIEVTNSMPNLTAKLLEQTVIGRACWKFRLKIKSLIGLNWRVHRRDIPINKNTAQFYMIQKRIASKE